MKPTVSNVSPTRFFYGSTTGDEGVVFHGAVVFGTDLTFDPVTHAPIGGVVDRIEFQTRRRRDDVTMHGVYADFNATVDQLQIAFAGSDLVWYDPALYFEPLVTPPTVPLHAVDDALILDTGDVLSAQEMSAIFKSASYLVPKSTPTHIIRPPLPPLVINFDDIVIGDDDGNVATTYTEADDILGDLLVGIA